MANSILAKMAVLISGDTSGLNKGIKSATKELTAFEKTAKGVGSVLATSFAAISFASIAKDIIDITAEFQKFEAVLTNTLGSSSAAQRALDSIRQFAQVTPFEVKEITAAYVRWANQGLNPTIDKMTKLGDVASSLGAGFEQTAEAFKDLLVGQTKRIEEIGISAQQSNGKIQLSFKGVNLEIEKSVAGVEEALNVFSQLEGVQGTSAIVAETLGGKISNLSDAWSNLLLTIGSGNSNTLKDAVDLLIGITTAAGKLVTQLGDTNTLIGKVFATVTNSFLLPAKALLQLVNGTDQANTKLEENNQKLKAIEATVKAAFDSGNIEAYIRALDNNINKEEIISEIRKRQAAEIAAKNAAVISEVETLDKLQAKLQQLNIDFEKTDKNDQKELRNIGNKIIGINAQIEALDNLRKKQESVQSAPDRKGQLVDESTLGGGFLSAQPLPLPDTSVLMNNLEMATSAVLGLRDAYGELGPQAMKTTEEQILAAEQLAQAEQRKGEMFQMVGGIIGDEVGEVVSGQKTVLQAIKSATAKLLPILLAQALAGTIAGAGKTTAPPPVIVALAAAGVAAVSALFRSATGHSGGGSSGGMGGSNLTNVSKFSPTTSAQAQPQQFEFVLHGDDLVASQTTQLNRNLRLGR